MLRDAFGDLLGYKRKELARANVAIGTLAGLLVGVATGLLVAPQSGKETREDIKKAAEQGYIKVADASHKAADFVKVKGQEVAGKFSHTKAELADEVAEAAEDVAHEAKQVSAKEGK